MGQRRRRTSFAIHAALLASHFTGLIQKGGVSKTLFSVAAFSVCQRQALTDSKNATEIHFWFGWL